jgi:hypothetical protein
MPIPQFLIDNIQNINGHVQQGIPIRSELRKGIEIEEQLGINNGVLRSLAQNMNYFNHQDEIYIDRNGVFEVIHDNQNDTLYKIALIACWGWFFKVMRRNIYRSNFVVFVNGLNQNINYNNYVQLNPDSIHNNDGLEQIYINLKYGNLKIPSFGSAYFTKILYFYSFNKNSPLIILDKHISKAIQRLNETLANPYNLAEQTNNFTYDEYKSYLDVFNGWLDGLQEIEPNINTTKLESFIFESQRNEAINLHIQNL